MLGIRKHHLHCRVCRDFPNPEYLSMWSAFSIKKVHVIAKNNDTSILRNFNRNKTYQSWNSQTSRAHSEFPYPRYQSIWSALSIDNVIQIEMMHDQFSGVSIAIKYTVWLVRSDFPNSEYQSIWSASSIVHVRANINDTRSILRNFKRSKTYQSGNSQKSSPL